MRAAVDTDHTTRIIWINVDGRSVDILDVTKSWHHKDKKRFIRPDRAVITIEDGVTTSIRVTGPVMLKSGAASNSVSDGFEWGPASLPQAPGWVQRLWSEAPDGYTLWRDA